MEPIGGPGQAGAALKATGRPVDLFGVSDDLRPDVAAEHEQRTTPAQDTLSALAVTALRAHGESAMYGVIADWVADHLAASRVTVALLGASGEEFEVVALPGGPGPVPVQTRIPRAGSDLGRVLEAARPAYWRPRPDGDAFEAPMLSAQGIGEVFNVPLWVDGSVTGVMTLARERGEVVSEGEQALMIELGGIVSANLERFRIVSRTREELARERVQTRLLERLTTIGIELSSASTWQQVFDVIAQQISDIVPADRVWLVAPERDSAKLVCVTARESERVAGGAAMDEIPDGSAVARVFRTARPMFFAELAGSDYPEHRVLSEAGLVTLLALPVPIAGRVGAVLSVGSCQHFDLDDDRSRAVQMLTSLAGSSLQRVSAQEESAYRAQRLDDLIDALPLMVLTVSVNGAIARVSRTGSLLLGRPAGSLRGSSMQALYSEDGAAAVTGALERLATSEVGTVEVWEAQLSEDSAGRWVRHTARRMAAQAGEPEVVMVCEDITRERELAGRLEYEATHDALTGLINRRELERVLGELSSIGMPFSLCVIDLDRFKNINDTSGHQAGDETLVALARLLRGSVRAGDLVARTGGDELILVLPGCRLPDAIRIAEKTRVAAGELVLAGAAEGHRISLSIGVAYSQGPTDVGTLLAEADALCYKAKAAGRDRVCAARPDEQE